MKNPYYIDEPCVISFSGGRTSAYMLIEILESHGGSLPSHHRVVFANTGKEMPETLEFVRRTGRELSVDIVWLECRTRLGDEGENKYVYETIEVDFDTASRNGEPFRELVLARRYAPNPVARFCTQELKVLRIRDYMNTQFPKEGRNQTWINIVGIRADEQRRVVKMNDRNDVYLPLNIAGATKEDVFNFWDSMPWDLELPNNNGTTDWGNCDLCFLKGPNKKLSLIRQRPDLATWWIELELELSDVVGKGAYFRVDQPSYQDMLRISNDQGDMFAGMDESIPCFCGD